MIGWLPWGLLTGLTAIIAVTDLRRHEIPNRWSVIAAGLGLVLMAVRVLPWTHLWWALAIWLLLELGDVLHPGWIGSGDIKWSVLTVGYLGSLGLLVIGLTQLVAMGLGLIRWLGDHRRYPWHQTSAPWGPGFLVGLLLYGGASLWLH